MLAALKLVKTLIVYLSVYSSSFILISFFVFLSPFSFPKADLALIHECETCYTINCLKYVKTQDDVSFVSEIDRIIILSLMVL